MLRAVISVGACLIVTASTDAKSEGWCVLDGSEAVNEMMDAGVFGWAASQRCTAQYIKNANAVRCEMDVASAAEAVNRMVNIILRAVKTCGLVSTDPCGVAASKLTAHFEGIAASSGGVVQECRNPLQTKLKLTMRDSLRANGAGMPLTDPHFPQGEQTICAVDLKDSMAQVFQVSVAVSKAKKNCDAKNGKCAYDAMDIISAFAGMGKYLMGAIGHCGAVNLPVKDFPLTCSEHIAGLTRGVMGFAADADDLWNACSSGSSGKSSFVPPPAPAPEEVIIVPAAAPRLYASADKDCKGDDCNHESSALNVALTALLPVAAVVGFVAGRRKRSTLHNHQEIRDMEFLEAAD